MLGEGNPQKTEQRWNNLKPAKLQTNPDFGQTMISNKHTKVWSGKGGRHLQNIITIKKIGQQIRTSARQDAQERNKGERRKMV